MQLLTGVGRVHNTIRPAEDQIQSLQRQVSPHPAELESLQSKVSQPDASLQAASRPSSIFQTAVIAVETTRGQSQALPDAGAQKSQEVKAILDEVRHRRLLDDHSSLVRSSNKMFRYDVNRVFYDYFSPILDAMSKHTVDFCSAPTSWVDMLGEMLL